MKTLRLPVLLGLIALLAAMLACGGSLSTANIGNAWLATDIDGANRTTVFAPGDDFYAFAELHNAPDDTQLKGVWTAVSVEGEQPDTVINETEFVSGDGTVYFQLTNDQLWPAGSYKVDIYLNGAIAKTLPFTVQ
jgi:hypothetical protein